MELHESIVIHCRSDPGRNSAQFGQCLFSMVEGVALWVSDSDPGPGQGAGQVPSTAGTASNLLTGKVTEKREGGRNGSGEGVLITDQG